MKYNHAVVVGKFYPPHKGHEFLIQTALDQSKQVTVIVCDKDGQVPHAELRANWLRKLFPRACVVVTVDDLPDDDSVAWAKRTIEILGHKPDAVFTSEAYGDPYAAALACKHVCVDRARKTVPISGTRVRENPFASWEYLSPIVRAYYAKRIVILGAESTGTTTLAKELALHYHTTWVPEYGRVYSEGKLFDQHGSHWTSEEFTHIARMQNTMENALAQVCNKLLICDTDAFATSVWHERYMECESVAVESLADEQNHSFYILTGDEIPFVQDGTRDGEHIRHSMHNRFEEKLKQTHRPYVVVRGTKQERLLQAVQVIDALFEPIT